MGFYFRKSVNIGGLKFNFSKSGVGVSTGIKGFRIGTGPRGNYIHMGRNGVYYRKTWSNNKTASNKTNNYRRYYNQKNDANSNDIDEYETTEIYDSSSKELIDEITNNNKKITSKWFSLLFCINVYAFIIAFIVFAIIDYKRKSTIIFYDIDEEAETKLQKFYDSFDELRKCNKKWYILSKNYNFDSKYNAGAYSLVDRKKLAITNTTPKYIKTNVKIPCIPVGKQKIYFFPDKILIFEGKKVGGLSYKNLEIEISNGNFIETGSIPSDGTIVNYTYKYVNKNGGPDRRFSNNPRYPIMRYSYITFLGGNGFNEVIMLSKEGIGNQLKEQINLLKVDQLIKENDSINSNNEDKKINNISKDDKIESINSIIKNTEEHIKQAEYQESKDNILSKLKLYENNNKEEIDPFLMEAIELVVETRQVSTSFIQRRFKIGYERAKKIVDQMEQRGIISRYQGSKPREILVSKEMWNNLKNNTNRVDENIQEKKQNDKSYVDGIERKNEIEDKKKNMFYKK